MLNKVVIAASLLVAAGLSHTASAAPHWQDSAWSPTWSFCGIATNAKVGYLLDLGSSPHTGDVTYIHAMVQAGCADDTAGLEFLLPTTVIPMDASYPIYCFKNGMPMSNSATGECSQKPQAGPNGGLFYGWSSLKPGEWFEIQIPVQWVKSLPGTMSVVADSGIAFITASIQPSIIWRPGFQKLTGASSADGTSANVSFELDHYYGAASVVVEYGNGAFDHATPPVYTDPLYEYYPNVTANLPGTTPLTTLQWRVKVTASNGTFYSDTQTLKLGAQLKLPTCGRFPC